MALTYLEVFKRSPVLSVRSQIFLQSPVNCLCYSSLTWDHSQALPQPTAAWQIALMPWGRLGFCYLSYISLLPLSTLCLQPLDMLISISLLRLSSTIFLPGEEFPLLTPTALQLLGVARCAISYPWETAVSFSLAYLSPQCSPTRLWVFKAKDNVVHHLQCKPNTYNVKEWTVSREFF